VYSTEHLFISKEANLRNLIVHYNNKLLLKKNQQLNYLGTKKIVRNVLYLLEYIKGVEI